MKQITAINQPHMLPPVEHALHALPHFRGFTLLRAKGHARGATASHPSVQWALDEQDKIALYILCSDALAPQIVETIRQNAHTGLPGDGLIGVCEAKEVVRIRTGERGDNAV